MEKVSIIIPLFNTEKWIGEMVDSILDQTYTNWELLIVDDGSTDNSSKVVERYQDERINLLHRDRLPKGAPTCRNIGLENSQGKYVVFIDSDDLLLPHAIEQRVKAIEEGDNYDFAIGGCKAFVQGESIDEALRKGRYTYGLFNGNPLSLLLKSRYPFIVCTNIYKRESLLANNIKWEEEIKVFQDFTFNFKVLNKGLTYNIVNPFAVDYLYRVGHSSTNITGEFISQEKFQSTLKLMKCTLRDIQQGEDIVGKKSDFIGFIVNYYLRILTVGSKEQKKEFLRFCKQYYGTFVISRLKLISLCSMLIPKFKYRMDILRLFVLIFFGIRII